MVIDGRLPQHPKEEVSGPSPAEDLSQVCVCVYVFVCGAHISLNLD